MQGLSGLSGLSGLVSGSSAAAAAFTPASISGLVLWLDATTGVYKDAGTTPAADGETVQQWTNQAGAPNATQATSGNRPTYKTAIQNGRSVLRFASASSTYLDLGTGALITATASFTVLYVAAESLTTAARRYLLAKDNDAGGRDYGIAYSGAADAYIETAGAPRLNTGSVSANVFHVGAFVVDASGNAITMWRDGAQIATAAYTIGQAATTSTTIGRRNYPANEDYLDGDIGELLAYNVALSPANRQLLEAYLKSRWNTP